MIFLKIFIPIFFILIFPIFANVNSMIDLDNKKIYFGGFLFSKIKVLSGVITLLPNNLDIKINKKQNTTYEYTEIFKNKVDLDLYKNIVLSKIDLIVEKGDNQDFNGIYSGLSINYLLDCITSVIGAKNKLIEVNKKVYLKSGEEFKISINLKLLFNIITIVIILFKIMIGGIKKKWKAKVAK